MTYPCYTWEYAADANLMKLQRVQKIFRATGNLDECTTVGELQVAFKMPYAYSNITKLCRIHAKANLNHVNPNVRRIVKGEVIYMKYSWKLATARPTSSKLITAVSV
jgi:hypothetical protein